MMFFASAFAQETAPATAAAASQQPAWAQFLPLAIIMVLFYFLMLRPQKKKMDEEKKFLDSLKKGDEVYTKAGVIGTVYGLTDKVVTIEISDNVKMRVLRSQVAGLAQSVFGAEATQK